MNRDVSRFLFHVAWIGASIAVTHCVLGTRWLDLEQGVGLVFVSCASFRIASWLEPSTGGNAENLTSGVALGSEILDTAATLGTVPTAKGCVDRKESCVSNERPSGDGVGLVLSRRENETIRLPDLDVTFTIVQVKGGRVRVGIKAPDKITIVRGEIEGRPAKSQTEDGVVSLTPR